MALINCSDCGKEISSEAAKCIHCGKPIQEVIVTTQSTSKQWKGIKLLSWVGLIMGIGFISNSNDFGWVLITFSIIGLIVSKFGAWWSNK